MRTHLFIGAAASALLVLGACGGKSETAAAPPSADLASTQSAPASTAPADIDAQVRQAQDFVNAAGQSNLVEIQTAQLALQKGDSADVKKFAQQMIDDHKAANDALKAAASAAALAPPPETLDDAHMRKVNDLTEPKGAGAFDRDFMAQQIDTHADAIGLLKGYAHDGAISQIKDYAVTTLPKLEENKTQAEAVEQGVKDSPAKPG